MLAALGTILLSCTTSAQGPESSSSVPRTIAVQGTQQAIEPYMPVYQPRKKRPTIGRIDGGLRGGKEGELVLRVLAPADHVGETVHASPTLHWYVSKPVSHPLTLTLEDVRQPKPVLEITLRPPIKPGVHRVRLADYGKTLEPEVSYRWHLSMPIDPHSSSKGLHVMGVIERVPYDQAIVEGRTACRNPRDAFCLYVQAGLWYDAIQVISDLITASPRDRVLHLQRAALLEKVGLLDVAEYDRLQYGP